MVARVTLEIALRREFDYLIPPELEGRVEVGTRVKVPFGRRQVLGCVTGLAERSDHDSLKPIAKIIGAQSLVTPRVLELARWIAEYYCCAPETALKSVLPDAVRKEQEGWRERLHVRLLPGDDGVDELTKRQLEVYQVIEENRSLPLQELLQITGTTAPTVRKLEDKGLIEIAPQISERDPYANEEIVPTQPLTLNPEQAAALKAINSAAGAPPADSKRTPYFNPKSKTNKFTGTLPHWRQPGKTYFITFRLADSIAESEIEKWRAAQAEWKSHHPKPWDENTEAEFRQHFSEKLESMLDAGRGECLLRQPAVAQVLEETLRKFDGERYHLADFVIMPNHVHALLQPFEGHELSAILHSWKSFTAHAINRELKRDGPVWREEYFDHLVRGEKWFGHYREYIQGNPGKAGITEGFVLGAGEWEPLACRRGAGSTTFLLHGVTGSGKTEVYLQAIAAALEQGKGAIVLVPEISLTPQTVERFKARFSSGPLKTLVAVLHSHLSAGERHDEWHKIRQGRAKIVIGARSAIFAPVEPLGLIIVDEEHEHSYKQEEAPRYHARDVAVVRGQREGATVVLGSATPSMESYHNAQRGRYQLLEMPSRADDKQMPLVRVQDMRTEKSKGDQGPPIFSQRLKEAIHNRLEQGEQTILFLNRRGFATSMQCPDCGFVAECPNCSLSLTYHRREQFLRCHVCGHGTAAPRRCPGERCGSPKIRFHGLGTEKVEDVLRKLFPRANVTRMDSDALKRKDDYRRILGDFRRGKIDILVGTQMIAKGLHFPRVTLVGIVYADTGLHLADFRAGERTFQLLTQVAGRAGRGEVEGEVVVQTFSPVHPAIQFSRRHDYEGYFEAEMEFREQLRYPPFTRAAMLTLRGRSEEKVAFSAEHVKKQIEPLTQTLEDLQLAGPAPAPLLRAETFYRYQLMLRTGRMSELSRHLAVIAAGLSFPDDVTLTIDIDPVNLY